LSREFRWRSIAAMPRPPHAAFRVLVIVNPASAAGRARRAAPAVAGLLRKRGVDAEFVESTSGDDIRRRAAEAAARGFTHAVALGGDGTFHHLVNGALGEDAETILVNAQPLTLGFFPAGHGNDIAAGLGIPQEPVAAAELFLRAPSRGIDVLRARCAGGAVRHFIGAGGAGLDAEAARLAGGRFRRWPGAARYVAGALWTLRNFRCLEMELRTESETWRGAVLLVAVANAPAYGSGVKVAPEAQMDDGLADITVVAPMAWPRLLETLPIVLRTGVPDWPEIHRLRARTLSLKASRQVWLHGDGELLGETPVEIDVLPRAVRVVAPARR